MRKIKVIPLPSVERLQELFNYDPKTGSLIWKKVTGRRSCVGKEAGTSRNGKYFMIGVDRKIYLKHRVIYKLYHKKEPEGVVDHIDRDASNNKINNLRDATHSVSNYNRSFKSEFGKQGVYKSTRSKGFCAKISNRHLGTFPTLEAASKAAEQERIKCGA